ncbi:DUF6350 family protein [Crossiella sp. CA-258035]|uniref:cell division protein PerM n=1 Tax=Crossiella sp. CA-258035 TaxID=2981138 RepID=UPI0024BC2BC2|nr:DUF6350 family protein [Crossiella sp. CA-258035]WHT18800.1 DUF6350 family protein [Crossiella sp. CA-258035]
MTVLRPTAHGSVSEPGVAAPPATAAQQVRAALAVALGVIALGYLGSAAVVALVMAGAERAVVSLEAVSAGAAPLWLAAHHVPLTVRGASLGVLPLLPTVAVVLLAARAAGGLARRLRLTRPADALRVVAVMGVAHVVVGGLLAAFVDPPFAAAPATGAVACGLVAALAATAGVARRCGLVTLVRQRFGEGVLAGLRAARIALMCLCAMGALIVALALALSFGSVRAAFADLAPGFGNGSGLVLLCLLYLPNAVVAALSFVAGSGFGLGAVVVSPLRVVGGQEPPFPLLAALPESGSRWWLLCLLLPIAAGVLLGWVCRKADPLPQNRLLVVGVAAAVVAAAALAAAALAGGRLGAVNLRVPAGMLAVALFCWVAAPAAVVAWLAGPRPEPEDEPADLDEAETEDTEGEEEVAEGDQEAVAEDEAAEEDAEEPEAAEPVAEEAVAEQAAPAEALAEEDFVDEEELEEALLEPPEEPEKR